MKFYKKIMKYMELLTLWGRYRCTRLINGKQDFEAPVCIVGCGHSGTTLLLNVLGTHSRIYAIERESGFAFKRRPNMKLKEFEMRALHAGKVRWVEKTPKHIRYIDRIMELCPDVRIIILVRDGRDVASSFKSRFGEIEPGIKQWVSDNRLGQEYWGHRNVLVVKYESIVEDFKSTMTEIMAFLDEEYEEELENFHTRKKSYFSTNAEKPDSAFGDNHGQHRDWQVNQPLFDGRGRWKELGDDELKSIDDVAHEMLVEFGYIDGDGAASVQSSKFL